MKPRSKKTRKQRVNSRRKKTVKWGTRKMRRSVKRTVKRLKKVLTGGGGKTVCVEKRGTMWQKVPNASGNAKVVNSTKIKNGSMFKSLKNTFLKKPNLAQETPNLAEETDNPLLQQSKPPDNQTTNLV